MIFSACFFSYKSSTRYGLRNRAFLVFLCKRTKNNRILKQFYLFVLGGLFVISGITSGVAKASDELYALLHELRSNNLGRWEASRTILHDYADTYNVAVDSLRANTDSTYTYSLARLVLAQALHEQRLLHKSSLPCNSLFGRFFCTYTSRFLSKITHSDLP